MTNTRTGFVKIAVLVGSVLAEPGHAQTTQVKANTDWQVIDDGTRIAGNIEGPRLVGHVQTGEVIHRVVFDCVTAPGGWWPSRWNGYKKLAMSVLSVDPAVRYATSHFDGPVTVATNERTFDILPDYTLRDDMTHIMAATVTVSDRVMDVLRREATLDVRFGDAASRFAFVFDIVSGRQKVLDYANSCK
jgi:hypothetical protein